MQEIKAVKNNRGYEEYWVAYFDILGFGADIENLHKCGVLERYNRVLNKIDLQKWAVDCKWFSDSFVFYKKNNSTSSFINISSALEMFFRSMFRNYIPLRGCLHIGGFHVDEKKGIFFGPSLIEAYKLAEKQEWIDFVLSTEVLTKLKQLKTNGETIWDKFSNKYHTYNVPCKRKEKFSLPVYNFGLSVTNFEKQQEEQSIDIWNSLITMEKKTQMFHEKEKKEENLQKCNEYRKVIIKYKNTKKFLLEIFPKLRNKTKGMNRHISCH